MSENTVTNDEKQGAEVPAHKAASVRHGELVEDIDDPVASEFYGGAVSETYRLKSELVARHLAGIGMGK